MNKKHDNIDSFLFNKEFGRLKFLLYLLSIFLFIFLCVYGGILYVPKEKRVLVLRLGRFHKEIKQSGLYFKIPLVDRPIILNDLDYFILTYKGLIIKSQISNAYFYYFRNSNPNDFLFYIIDKYNSFNSLLKINMDLDLNDMGFKVISIDRDDKR